MAPITRSAAFKFKTAVPDSQKRNILEGLMALYEEDYLTNHGPGRESIEPDRPLQRVRFRVRLPIQGKCVDLS
jgi:hypothetical protein